MPGLYQAATDNSKILSYIMGFVVLAKFTLLFLVQSGWYHNVVYLGNERDIPILTMTYTPRHFIFCLILFF